MSLKIYKVSEYETTHEREQFDKLSEILKKEYDNHEDTFLLIANPSFDNRDIDVVFIKRDAIAVLELKNYGGNLFVAENGDWKCNNEIVKGGSNNKNPFLQVKINKTGLCRILDLWFNKSYVNLAHTSGIVVFNQPIEIKELLITPQVATWFHITDMNTITAKLRNITSRSINYTNDDLEDLIDRLNLTDSLIYKTNTSKKEIEQEIEEKAELFVPKDLEQIKNDIEKCGFKTIKHFPIPERDGKTKNISELNLSKPANTFLQKKVNANIWEHQYEAIEKYNNGKNICVSTSTSSGKSLIFYSSGIELLTQDPNAKIIAVYPLRALGSQQEDNWRDAILESGLSNVKVGKVDGSVKSKEDKAKILKECSVIIVTPDVIHTFLLGKLKDQEVGNTIKKFLKNTKLVIIDEIHTYTGIFGSNVAYMYRRLNHAIDVLQGRIPQYISASATIDDPESHLKKIVGVDFEIVSNDTSPKNATDILLIEPNETGQLLDNILNLESYFVTQTDKKGITFLDSRKMVEQVGDNLDGEIYKLIEEKHKDDLPQNSVIVYKAGYEEELRQTLDSQLRDGTFRSVIATSTLEMGIDIKHLNLCILLGIPYSSTSFYQRIGRVGRIGGGKGLVIIINDNSVRSKTIFEDPKRLLEIPMTEGALYLENENLQNIHALCFAEPEEEYDAVNGSNPFTTTINFPKSFIEKCNLIRGGIQSIGYEEVKERVAYNYPQYTYPVRDLEPQFKVELHRGGHKVADLGNLSRSQLQREAYPGAIYRYNKRPYRVFKVVDKKEERKIYVKDEKFSRFDSTKQLQYTIIYPQLIDEKVFYATKYDALSVLECELRIVEKVTGFRETHGNSSVDVHYPLTTGTPVYYRQNEFRRDFKTTGTILSHPALSQPNVNTNIISQLIYEVFLLNIPFEKQDVNYGKNKFPHNALNFEEGVNFIAIYDQSFGSLRLTKRLTELEELKKVFKITCELINDPDYKFSLVDNEEINEETANAIFIMRNCLNEDSHEIQLNSSGQISVIKIGSECLYQGVISCINSIEYNRKGRLCYKIQMPIQGGTQQKLVPIEEVEKTEKSKMDIFIDADE